MRKIRILAAALLALAMVLAMCSCGAKDGVIGGLKPVIDGKTEDEGRKEPEKAGPPVCAGQYSTVFEQSELRWYISEKYGQDAVEKYCFYDLDDQGEGSMILAVRVSDGTGPEMLARAFNKDLHDWYEYNSDIFVSSGSEEYGETENGGSKQKIYKITLDADKDVRNEYSTDIERMWAYVTRTPAGLLSSVFIGYDSGLSYGMAGRYEYDGAGGVLAYLGYEWDVSYSEFYEDPDWNPYWTYTYRYEYSGDGMLEKTSVEITQTTDTEDTWTDSEWTFEYAGKDRVKTVFCEYYGSDAEHTVMDETRDGSGLLVSAKTYQERYDEERQYSIAYESGGFCIYSRP